MDKEIVVKPSFDIKSSMKALFYVLCKPLFIFFYSLLLVIGILNMLDYYLNISREYENTISDFPTFPIVIILAPLLLYYVFSKLINKQLNENPRLKEDISYIFNNEYFQEKGESFEVKHFWKNLIEIVEKNDWFLIYINKKCAKVIRKTDLKDNQYNELKELFSSLNIKKSLK